VPWQPVSWQPTVFAVSPFDSAFSTVSVNLLFSPAFCCGTRQARVYFVCTWPACSARNGPPCANHRAPWRMCDPGLLTRFATKPDEKSRLREHISSYPAPGSAPRACRVAFAENLIALLFLVSEPRANPSPRGACQSGSRSIYGNAWQWMHEPCMIPPWRDVSTKFAVKHERLHEHQSEVVRGIRIVRYHGIDLGSAASYDRDRSAGDAPSTQWRRSGRSRRCRFRVRAHVRQGAACAAG
jgi:hypothetical protein